MKKRILIKAVNNGELTKEQQKDKQEDTAKKQNFWADIAGSFIIPAALLMPGSFLIPAYQAIRWLMTGIWQSLNTTVLFSRILPDEAWQYLTGEPTSWIGLHKILSVICCDMPLFGFVFLLGMVLVLIICN